MPHFLHIFIYPQEGFTRDHIEKKLDFALDWFRYYSNLYLVYTTASVSKWQDHLESVVAPNGMLFICNVNIRSRNGWMPKNFWDWLKDKQEAI